ncbi:MAG: riboflavin synthase [Candidatus Aminicenantes bacterium]|nr:riboflavin synthase [Candidatus Aminicenantes bacterium]
MFTGLISHLGRFREYRQGKTVLLIEVPEDLARRIEPGQSLAVDGVCLTLLSKERFVLVFSLSRETREKSTLGDLKSRQLLNLELPVTLETMLGGHLVTGHIDAVGQVAEVKLRSPGKRMKVKHPPELKKFLVEKGSVAVNGVSLTVASTGPDFFEVELIPATLSTTNLDLLRAGQRVNLECDIIGKYVYNFISKISF